MVTVEWSKQRQFALKRGGTTPGKKPDMRVNSTYWASCLVAGGAWLVLDLVLRDPWTVLFIVIALGSDMLVRLVTGGVFFDANAPVAAAARTLVCVALFAGPGFVLRWSSSKLFKARVVSLVIVGWLVFYLAALAFLFPPGMP